MRIDSGLHAPRVTDATPPGGSVQLRLVFPSTQASVRAALASTMSGLGAMRLSEDDGSTVELVLAEVLNNVAEHAFRDDPEGMIELHLTQTSAGLSCRVMDRGDSMPDRRLPPGPPPDPTGPLVTRPEGGFGWYLIRRLTRDLSYMRHQNRNVLSFSIEVGHTLRNN